MEGQRARVRGQKAERHSTNRALSPGKAWGDHSHADSGYPQVSSPEAPWDPHTPKLRKPGKLLCKAHLSSGHWAVLRAEGLSSYGIQDGKQPSQLEHLCGHCERQGWAEGGRGRAQQLVCWPLRTLNLVGPNRKYHPLLPEHSSGRIVSQPQVLSVPSNKN